MSITLSQNTTTTINQNYGGAQLKASFNQKSQNSGAAAAKDQIQVIHHRSNQGSLTKTQKLHQNSKKKQQVYSAINVYDPQSKQYSLHKTIADNAKLPVEGNMGNIEYFANMRNFSTGQVSTTGVKGQHIFLQSTNQKRGPFHSSIDQSARNSRTTTPIADSHPLDRIFNTSASPFQSKESPIVKKQPNKQYKREHNMVEQMRYKRQKLEDKFYQTLTSQFNNSQQIASPLQSNPIQIQSINQRGYQQDQPIMQAYDQNAYYSAPMTANNNNKTQSQSKIESFNLFYQQSGNPQTSSIPVLSKMINKSMPHKYTLMRKMLQDSYNKHQNGFRPRAKSGIRSQGYYTTNQNPKPQTSSHSSNNALNSGMKLSHRQSYSNTRPSTQPNKIQSQFKYMQQQQPQQKQEKSLQGGLIIRKLRTPYHLKFHQRKKTAPVVNQSSKSQKLNKNMCNIPTIQRQRRNQRTSSSFNSNQQHIKSSQFMSNSQSQATQRPISKFINVDKNSYPQQSQYAERRVNTQHDDKKSIQFENIRQNKTTDIGVGSTPRPIFQLNQADSNSNIACETNMSKSGVYESQANNQLHIMSQKMKTAAEGDVVTMRSSQASHSALLNQNANQVDSFDYEKPLTHKNSFFKTSGMPIEQRPQSKYKKQRASAISSNITNSSHIDDRSSPQMRNDQAIHKQTKISALIKNKVNTSSAQQFNGLKKISQINSPERNGRRTNRNYNLKSKRSLNKSQEIRNRSVHDRHSNNTPPPQRLNQDLSFELKNDFSQDYQGKQKLSRMKKREQSKEHRIPQVKPSLSPPPIRSPGKTLNKHGTLQLDA